MTFHATLAKCIIIVIHQLWYHNHCCAMVIHDMQCKIAKSLWRRPKEIETWAHNLTQQNFICGKYWKRDQRKSKQRIPFLQKLQPSKCWISIYAPIQFVLQVLQRKEIQRVSLRNNASIYKSPPVIQLDSLPSTHINASNSVDSLTVNNVNLTC